MNATLFLTLAVALLLVLVPIVSVQTPRFRAIKAREEDRIQAKEEEKKEETGKKRSYSKTLWTGLAVLGGLLLLFAYAILIAYCLAWFIIYQTEARLYEARRGLLQGGEMRLCLCSRG